MSGFLIDTIVISEFIKPQPDSKVIGWLEAADPESLFASVITFGEIRLGVDASRQAPPGETQMKKTTTDWLNRVA